MLEGTFLIKDIHFSAGNCLVNQTEAGATQIYVACFIFRYFLPVCSRWIKPGLFRQRIRKFFNQFLVALDLVQGPFRRTNDMAYPICK